MKEIAKALKLGTSGSKRILFNRIRDSVDSRITKIDVDTFNYKTKKQAAQSVPELIVLDEQTISFKGRSELKLRITYKREGDGFQCDEPLSKL